ncbi:hypothetical protein [Bacillus alveayuensis]|uniref:hypothetical protein n=1 Tax=Aeribacillus alveayuensis TaxID=279215 RepID=UPI0005CCBF1A|nr:hypothetical protein [Bacillus alveayuensis]
MVNKFEKELEKLAKSKHEGHDEVIKKFEKWSKELDENIRRMNKANEEFLKEVEGKLGYMNRWFMKKEKQLAKMLHFLQ